MRWESWGFKAPGPGDRNNSGAPLRFAFNTGPCYWYDETSGGPHSSVPTPCLAPVGLHWDALTGEVVDDDRGGNGDGHHGGDAHGGVPISAPTAVPTEPSVVQIPAPTMLTSAAPTVALILPPTATPPTPAGSVDVTATDAAPHRSSATVAYVVAAVVLGLTIVGAVSLFLFPMFWVGLCARGRRRGRGAKGGGGRGGGDGGAAPALSPYYARVGQSDEANAKVEEEEVEEEDEDEEAGAPAGDDEFNDGSGSVEGDEDYAVEEEEDPDASVSQRRRKVCGPRSIEMRETNSKQ